MKRVRFLCGVLVWCLLAGVLGGCGTGAEETFADGSVSGNGTDKAQDGRIVVEGEPISGNGVPEETDEDKNGAGSEKSGAENGADETHGGVGGEGNAAVGSDENGNGEKDGNAEGQKEEGSVEDEREAVKVKGIYVSGPIAGHSKMDDLIALVDETELNAMVIDIKNDDGRVTYKMETDTVLEIGAGINYIKDIDELVKKCKEKNIYLIARIVAFRDPYLAEQKPELAVKTKAGAIFRDKSGLAWVNPYKKEVWDYLMEVAKGAAEAGFDEIQFDYIRFSTDLKAGEMDFGADAEGIDKIEIITQFTEYAYETLKPLGVFVAADVFGTVIDNETDQKIVGQDYAKMAAHLDYICPMVYPSHYVNGAYGIPVPDAEPYRTIYAAMQSSAEVLSVVPEQTRAQARVWLQGFTASWVPGHISYGKDSIRAQMKGAYDAGYDEWILWNASVRYERDTLLTEEEAEAERQQWETEKASQGAETVSGNG